MVFGWIDLNMEAANDLNDFDSLVVQNLGGIISNLVEGRAKATEEFWRNLALK